MFRGLWSKLFDEVMGLVLLHGYLWYRRQPPVRGPALEECPGLRCGDLREFFAPIPDPVDLTTHRVEVARRETDAVSDFWFPSSVATPFPENNQVWCRHWAALTSRRITIVGVHGIVQLGSGWFRRLADVVTPHGIDVILLDSPYNFRRTPAGYRPGQLIVGGDLNHQLAVARQGVLDVWRLVRSLQAEGRRVGLVGLSHGGWLALMTALLADDLELVYSLVPPVNLFELLKEGGTLVRAVRRGLGDETLDPAHLEHVMRAITPIHWQPRLDPSRITLYAARYDRFVPPRRIEELARHWGARLVMCEDAHYHLTIDRGMIREIGQEIVERLSA